MTWETFYDNYTDYSEDELLKLVGRLTDFFDDDEVTEVAADLYNVKIASLLVKRAAAQGIDFSSDNIVELCGVIDEQTLTLILEDSNDFFDEDQFEEISEYCENRELLERIAEENDIGDPILREIGFPIFTGIFGKKHRPSFGNSGTVKHGNGDTDGLDGLSEVDEEDEDGDEDTDGGFDGFDGGEVDDEDDGKVED